MSNERSCSRGPSSSSSPHRSSVRSTPSSTVESLAAGGDFQPQSEEALELDRELAELSRRRETAGDTESVTSAGLDQAAKDQLPAFLLQSRQEIKERFEDLEWTGRELVQQHTKTLEVSQPYGEFADQVAQRNRYVNVEAYSFNRVLLNVPHDHINYINASPISLNRHDNDDQPSRYISTQGPKEDTISHFWHMVWHENTAPTVIIVMLTRVVEMGKIKCCEYVPRADPEVESIPVFLDSHGTENPAYTLYGVQSRLDENLGCQITEWELKNEETNETKHVLHYAFEEWPDFSVPEGANRRKLVNLVRETQKLAHAQPECPRFVHCSAGVGRSGTYIALDHLFRMMNEDYLVKDKVAQDKDLVHDTVEALRRQRMMMVQGEMQYKLIYDIVREELCKHLDTMTEAMEA